MGLTCGMQCLKILLFAFNFIFWLLGIAVLGIGVWSLIDVGSWKSLVDGSKIFYTAYMMIASGAVVAIIGFLGCCGALKKNRCMLKFYTVMVFLIFILELAAGIYAYMKTSDVQKEIKSQLFAAIKNSYGKKDMASIALTKAVDWFQKNVKCCGSANATDWQNSTWYNVSMHRLVPKSCCVKKADACNRTATTIATLLNRTTIYKDGCVDASKQFIKNHMWTVGGVAIGIGVFQLLGIVFALCLCKAIHDEMKVSTA